MYFDYHYFNAWWGKRIVIDIPKLSISLSWYRYKRDYKYIPLGIRVHRIYI